MVKTVRYIKEREGSYVRLLILDDGTTLNNPAKKLTENEFYNNLTMDLWRRPNEYIGITAEGSDEIRAYEINYS